MRKGQTVNNVAVYERSRPIYPGAAPCVAT